MLRSVQTTSLQACDTAQQLCFYSWSMHTPDGRTKLVTMRPCMPPIWHFATTPTPSVGEDNKKLRESTVPVDSADAAVVGVCHDQRSIGIGTETTRRMKARRTARAVVEAGCALHTRPHLHVTFAACKERQVGERRPSAQHRLRCAAGRALADENYRAPYWSRVWCVMRQS